MNPLSITEDSINKELERARARAVYLYAQIDRFQELLGPIMAVIGIPESEISFKEFDRIRKEFRRIFAIRDMSGELTPIQVLDDPLLENPKISEVWNGLLDQLSILRNSMLMIGKNENAIRARQSIKIFLKKMYRLPDFSELIDIIKDAGNL